MDYYHYLKEHDGQIELEGLTIFIPEALEHSVGHPVLVFEASKRYLLFRDSQHIHSWTGSVWTYMCPPNLDKDTALKLMAAAIPVVSKREEHGDNFSERIFELHGVFRQILAAG